MVELFEPLLLARIQFAFTVSFHIIFPAFTIGLASYLMVLEALWLWKKDDRYLLLFNYWLRIFAVAFGMGVVSGLTMSYQFGTNWSVFSDKTGPILGPLMAYEVLSAFFLEAGFLGVMLFGRERVGNKIHFLATCMVAAGTLFSAFWILSVNSWMHTPTGFSINADGQFIPEDWWAIVFNPSFPYRFTHMVLAAYLATAFTVGGVSAWHLLKHPDNAYVRKSFSMAMWMATLVAPLQILVGDLHGLNTLEYQPAKIAALEGHYETRRGAPLILFGIPDDEKEQTGYALAIPKLGSLILTHDLNGEVQGLKAFERDKRPSAEIIFWTFRLMLLIGLLMFTLGLWSLIQRWRGRLFQDHWLHRSAVLLAPGGFIAILAGWVTTESGRQPYTVYGHLLTSESSSNITGPVVGYSLMAYVLVYLFVFSAGIFYMLRLMRKRPDSTVSKHPDNLDASHVQGADHEDKAWT